jgi:hypothetical protein
VPTCLYQVVRRLGPCQRPSVEAPSTVSHATSPCSPLCARATASSSLSSSRDAPGTRETRFVCVPNFLAKLLGRKCAWKFGDGNADSLSYQRRGQAIRRNFQRRPHVGLLESRPASVPRPPSQDSICGGENNRRHSSARFWIHSRMPRREWTWPGARRPRRWKCYTEVLAETVSENDPASPRYQAGLRDDFGNDGQSISVTEFMSSILAPTNRS